MKRVYMRQERLSIKCKTPCGIFIRKAFCLFERESPQAGLSGLANVRKDNQRKQTEEAERSHSHFPSRI